ncbi:MAG: ATP-binding protein [Campylobacterota bacterium]|nr:ATP-binding protein [Campylobacterota bacterium]
MFEPYFTTRHKSQGTGLGLYIAKLIIEESLEGILTVSNSSKGASFEIQLPL